MTGPGRDPAEGHPEHPALPPVASSGDDATADLLRGVLRRRAEAVHPSPDGLSRILAAAHTAAGSPGAPSAGAPSGDAGPGREGGSENSGGSGITGGPESSGPTLPVTVRGITGRPVPRGEQDGSWFGRPHPLPLGMPGPSHRTRVPGWLPMLAAAAAVVLMVGGLGMTRLGVLQAPGLTNVVGEPAASAPAPHPPAVDPLPVYLVERQNDRWALVREFTPTTLTAPADRLTEALRLATRGEGTDRDHTSAWAAAGAAARPAELTADSTGGGVVVRLGAGLLGDGSASDDERGTLADLAVAQLVWTATATVQDNAPVRIDGPVAGAVLFGTVRLGRVFERDTSTLGDPRAPVWVSSLVDGQKLAPGRAVIQGDAVTTDSGTVAWRLLPEGGPQEVAGGAAPLHREDGSTPRPGERGVWQVTLQLPARGRYVLQVTQPWPGSPVAHSPTGTGSAAADTVWLDTNWLDTKTLVVR